MQNSMQKKLIKITTAVALSLGLWAGSAVHAPQPTVQAAAVSPATIAHNVIADGERYFGVPYKFGARTGNTGSFDCSSFTQYMYRLNGISIPRTSQEQSRTGTFVPRSQLKPGDLVFFYSPIHHVAIYIGNGKILHTYGKPGVTISNMNSGWWNTHYATARRVIPNLGQANVAAVKTTVSSTAHTAAASAAAAHTATVVRGVNFRTGPSLRDARIRLLNRGEKVTLLSKFNAYWYKVRDSHGKVGYVTTSAYYLRS